MGTPIIVEDLHGTRVMVEPNVLEDRWEIYQLRVGLPDIVLCTNDRGVYFFDHDVQEDRWDPRHSRVMKFKSREAAVIFIYMLDPDLLVDKYHSDAIIRV